MSTNHKNASGVLNIDKPPSLTSHDIVAHIRRLLPVTGYQLPAAKVGHAGTLDPFATGVLLILVGPAARLMEYVNLLPKTYEARLTLGAVSDTDDVTGKITRSKFQNPSQIPMAQIRKTLTSFIGSQQQIPPAYSAVKVKGQKAYKAARGGKPLALKPKTVRVYNIRLMEYEYPRLSLEVTCGSGTYIRSLGRDIGQALGTGAYISELRRASIGPAPASDASVKQPAQQFSAEKAVDLNELTQENLPDYLLPPRAAVSHLPAVQLNQSNVAQLSRGQKIKWGSGREPQANRPVALLTEDKELVGIGSYDSQNKLLSPKKILTADNL